MNVSRTLAFVLLSALRVVQGDTLPASAPADLAVDFRLLNGDGFPGTFLDFSGGMLRVQPSWASEAIRIPARNLSTLIPPQTAPSDPVPTPHRILLTNGNELQGRMVDATLQHLRLETHWGQTLTIHRSHIQSVEWNPPLDSMLVKGPFPLSQWKTEPMSSARGVFEHSVVPGRGLLMGPRNVLSREVPPLPEKFLIEFRLSADQQPHFTISFQNASAKPVNPPPFYSIMLIMGNLQIRSNRQNANVQLADLGNGPWHFQLYHDRIQGKISVVVNGERKGNLALPLTDLKNEMLMSIRSMRSEMVLESLVVAHWDGLFDIEMPQKALPVGHARVRLNNGDILDGLWEGVRDGNLLFKTLNDTSLLLDVNRIREIHTTPTRRQVSRRYDRDVRLVFANQSQPFTLQLSALDPQQIRGSSEAVLEEILIPMGELGRLDFNPYLLGRDDSQRNRAKWRSLTPSRSAR